MYLIRCMQRRTNRNIWRPSRKVIHVYDVFFSTMNTPICKAKQEKLRHEASSLGSPHLTCASSSAWLSRQENVWLRKLACFVRPLRFGVNESHLRCGSRRASLAKRPTGSSRACLSTRAVSAPAIRSFEREALTDASAALMEDGVVIVRDLIGRERIDRVAAELRPELDKQEPGGGETYGKRAKILGALFYYSKAIEDIVADPNVLAVIDPVLLPNCASYRLGLTAALEVYSGGNLQELHRDSLVYEPYLQLKGEAMVSVMIAATDFTAENGATRVAVGSHAWPRERVPLEEELTQVEMRAGSAAFWVGNLVHGMAINRTESPRLGIILSYALGWLSQEEDQLLVVPPERARALPAAVRKILGYEPYEEFLGWRSSTDVAEAAKQ